MAGQRSEGTSGNQQRWDQVGLLMVISMKGNMPVGWRKLGTEKNKTQNKDSGNKETATTA